MACMADMGASGIVGGDGQFAALHRDERGRLRVGLAGGGSRGGSAVGGTTTGGGATAGRVGAAAGHSGAGGMM